MNILIVAPVFYPDKSVGAARMTSLANYLAGRDITVHVLTNRKKEAAINKRFMYHFVDEIKTGCFLTEFQENSKRYIRGFTRIAEQYHIDCVIISGGPFYTFPITGQAKKRKIKCILDFRDPWVFDVREDYYTLKNLIREIYYLPKERMAVANADAVTTATTGWGEKFRKYYPLRKKKFHVIENGYDDAQLQGIEKAPMAKKKKLTIGVFGKLFYYSSFYSNVFVKELSNFSTDVDVLQIGDKEEQADSIIERNGLDKNVISSTGFMPYQKGISLLMNADCFLIIDDRKDAIGTKIYDYIFIGKPIFFVGPKDSYFSRFINKYKLGYSCENADEIDHAMRHLIAGDSDFTFSDQLKQSFSRSRQNTKWFQLIARLAEKH